MDKQEFENYLKKIPKAEIHVHIEAVITLDTVKKLYKNRFEKEMSQEEQDSLFSYEDLNGFIQSFLKVQDLLVCEDDFNFVFDDLSNYLVTKNFCAILVLEIKEILWRRQKFISQKTFRQKVL